MRSKLAVWCIALASLTSCQVLLPETPHEGAAPDSATLIPSPADSPTHTPPPTASPTADHPVSDDIARLLADPPGPGAVVEIDAYLPSRRHAPFHMFSASYDDASCPRVAGNQLTDQPHEEYLIVLRDQGQYNILPEDSAWLVPVDLFPVDIPKSERYRRQPFRARLRGALSDNVDTDCPHADRVFVVQDIVTDYGLERPLPTTLITNPDWPVYENAEWGYSLPLPSACDVAEHPDGTVLLHCERWPGGTIAISAREGETTVDDLLPEIQDGRANLLQQLWSYPPRPIVRLEGFRVLCPDDEGRKCIRAMFSHGGRTYELRVVYPVGFDAHPEFNQVSAAIVNNFRTAAQATKTPTPTPTPLPPLRDALGDGPLLSLAEAEHSLERALGTDVAVAEAQLVSEREATSLARSGPWVQGYPGPCSERVPIPLYGDGFWVLTAILQEGDGDVHATFLLGGTSGRVICRLPARAMP